MESGGGNSTLLTEEGGMNSRVKELEKEGEGKVRREVENEK